MSIGYIGISTLMAYEQNVNDEKLRDKEDFTNNKTKI